MSPTVHMWKGECCGCHSIHMQARTGPQVSGFTLQLIADKFSLLLCMFPLTLFDKRLAVTRALGDLSIIFASHRSIEVLGLETLNLQWIALI